MLRTVGTLIIALFVASPGAAGDVKTFADLTPASQAYLKRHARTTFELPDGSVWDGYTYFEMREVVDTHLRLRAKKQSVRAGPIFREERITGYEWQLPDDVERIRAWKLSPVSPPGRNEALFSHRGTIAADAGATDNWPVLWHTSLDHPANRPTQQQQWMPIHFDDGPFAGTSATRRGEEIEVIQEFENGTLTIRGKTPHFGAFYGRAVLHPDIHPKNGRITGQLFVHRPASSAPTEATIALTPVSACRVDPERLFTLVQEGRLTLYEFDYSRSDTDRYLWRRIPFALAFRAEPHTRTESTEAPAEQTPESALPKAPDRIVLNDGRSFSGILLAQTDDSVTIRAVFGTMTTDLTFSRAEVRSIEKSPRPPSD